MNEDFHKKVLMKPEEDVDLNGNQGFFKAKKEFKICIILNASDANLT